MVPPMDISTLCAKRIPFLNSPYFGQPHIQAQQFARNDNGSVGRCPSGFLKIQVNQSFALADAAKAHIALEARQTTGSTVLVP